MGLYHSKPCGNPRNQVDGIFASHTELVSRLLKRRTVIRSLVRIGEEREGGVEANE